MSRTGWKLSVLVGASLALWGCPSEDEPQTPDAAVQSDAGLGGQGGEGGAGGQGGEGGAGGQGGEGGAGGQGGEGGAGGQGGEGGAGGAGGQGGAGGEGGEGGQGGEGGEGGAGGVMPCDADADADAICDNDDSACNADGQPLTCRRMAPVCPPDTVPEVVDGCYTDRCVTWAACGEPAPCRDTDGDRICDADDSACNADGQPLTCRRVAPNCPRGTVPEVVDRCYTDRCVTWADCGDEPPCPDTDGDEICDAEDRHCNADGTPLNCRVPEPRCPEGTVAEIRGGCFTQRCLPWQLCGEPLGGECRNDRDCAADEACIDGICEAVMCDRTPSVDREDRFYERFEGIGAPNNCRQDADCVVSGCSAEICAAEALPSTCEGLPYGPEGACGCVEGQCQWYVDSCDPAPSCDPVRPGEFGDCEAALGWAVDARSGQCAPVSGCGCDEGCERIYPDRAACEASCGGEPQPQACGGFAGLPCPDGEICIDDPRDDCDPHHGGADCPGICDEMPAACEPIDFGEFGLCRQIIGWGIRSDTNECGQITGCACDERCDGRVFETQAECQRACDAPDPCPDADGDRICDQDDRFCNPDGEVQCRALPPECRPGTVPEARGFCWTGRCVTWEQCGGVAIECRDDRACPDGERCIDGLCQEPLACEPVPTVSPRDRYYERFEGVGFNNACRTDNDCFTSGCSGEICAAELVDSTCEGLPYAPQGGCGCVDGQCIWHRDACAD